jgi:cytidyltransferase-like protein
MIIDYDKLKELRENNKNKKIVLVLGSFDLIHFEHVNFINDAKKLGDILVVAVKDNLSVKLKGDDRPIIDEEQRLFMVDNLKSVDYSILTTKHYDLKLLNKDLVIPNNKENYNWWEIFYEIFEKLRPDILYYENSKLYQDSRVLISKMFGVKLVERVRTERISTTKIINKIRSNQLK